MRPASYIRVFARLMHTGGRRAPYQPLGGAAAKTPTNPNPPSRETSVPPPLPSETASSSQAGNLAVEDVPAIASKAPNPSTRHTAPPGKEQKLPYDRRGRREKVRPQRQIPVRTAGGYLEPDSYPPSSSWLQANEDDKRSPHPLWKFFYVPEGSTKAPTRESIGPIWGGSISLFEENDRQQMMSGECDSASSSSFSCLMLV